jgi:hypothetical protein
MKLSGLTILGVIVSAAGWLWLIFGVGIALPDSSRAVFGASSVINLQLLSLAEQTCLLGYILILGGILNSGFRWLKEERHAPSAAPPVAMAAPRAGNNLDRLGDGYKLRDIG